MLERLTEKKIDECAKRLWNYSLMHHELRPADLIFVFGGTDLSLAEHAAQLYKDSYATKVMISGGFGKKSKLIWNEPEAVVLSKVAIENGVDESNIILEDEATNTGENISKSLSILERKRIPHETIIFVTKPYFERRAYNTLMKQWPGVDAIMSSQNVTFEEYVANPPRKLTKEDIINLMVGNLDRIMKYPEKGFTIQDEVPEGVLSAQHFLTSVGFNKLVLK